MKPCLFIQASHSPASKRVDCIPDSPAEIETHQALQQTLYMFFFPLAGYSIGYRFLSQGSRDGVCDKCHMKYISMSLLSVVNFHVVSFKQHESKCPKVKESWMTPQPSARPDDLHQGARTEAR